MVLVKRTEKGGIVLKGRTFKGRPKAKPKAKPASTSAPASKPKKDNSIAGRQADRKLPKPPAYTRKKKPVAATGRDRFGPTKKSTPAGKTVTKKTTAAPKKTVKKTVTKKKPSPRVKQPMSQRARDSQLNQGKKKK